MPRFACSGAGDMVHSHPVVRVAGSRAAGDKAATESFSRLGQKKVLNRRSLAPPDELRSAVVRWSERTQYRRRGQTPVEAIEAP